MNNKEALPKYVIKTAQLTPLKKKAHISARRCLLFFFSIPGLPSYLDIKYVIFLILIRAAFQYGIKMSEGRKTRRFKETNEKAELDRQWKKISAVSPISSPERAPHACVMLFSSSFHPVMF